MQSRSARLPIAALLLVLVSSTLAMGQIHKKDSDTLVSTATDRLKQSNIVPLSSLRNEEIYNRGVAMYRKGEYAKAARIYQESCNGGNGSACTNLGYLHERGLGVDKDETVSAALYRQGCDTNDAQGCSNLALLYFQGRGVEKDLHQAAELNQRGCDGGSASGCANLGTIYWKGSGVPKNEELGARLMQRGCDGGIAQACRSLGFFYETGRGVTKDDSRA